MTHMEQTVFRDQSVIPRVQTPTNLSVMQSQMNYMRKRQRDNDNRQVLRAKKQKTVSIVEPKVTLSDVAGIDKILGIVNNLLFFMKHPEIYNHSTLPPPSGCLFYGPSGCGKTLLAHAMARELNVPLLKIAGPKAGISSESEVRELFVQALAIAPCVIFLGQITTNRATAQGEMERRICAELKLSFNKLSHMKNGDKVLVIATTNQRDSLDPFLRILFNYELYLGIPNEEARAKILAIHTKKLALAPNVSLSTIASLTSGFTGADLINLIKRADMASVKRMVEREDLYKLTQKKKVLEMITEKEDKQTEPKKEAQAFENSGNQSDITQEHPFYLSNWLRWLCSGPPFPPEYLTPMCIEHSDFETALRILPSARKERDSETEQPRYSIKNSEVTPSKTPIDAAVEGATEPMEATIRYLRGDTARNFFQYGILCNLWNNRTRESLHV